MHCLENVVSLDRHFVISLLQESFIQTYHSHKQVKVPSLLTQN